MVEEVHKAQKGMHLRDSFWYWPIIHCLYFLGCYVDPICIDQVSQKGDQTVVELALNAISSKTCTVASESKLPTHGSNATPCLFCELGCHPYTPLQMVTPQIPWPLPIKMSWVHLSSLLASQTIHSGHLMS